MRTNTRLFDQTDGPRSIIGQMARKCLSLELLKPPSDKKSPSGFTSGFQHRPFYVYCRSLNAAFRNMTNIQEREQIPGCRSQVPVLWKNLESEKAARPDVYGVPGSVEGRRV